MADSPPAALLRLRAADVVRLCGLDAAARALDLVRERALAACRREGLRLQAAVRLDEQAVALPWVEVAPDEERRGVGWGCSCLIGQAHEVAEQGGTAAQPLACEHVAALLTAWIRAPGEFKSPTPDALAPQRPAHGPARDALPAAPAAPAPAMPAAAAGSARAGGGSARERFTLAEELGGLPAERLRALAAHALAGQSPLPLEREEQIGALVRALSDATHLAATAGQLDADARGLLRAVVLLGGAVTAAELRGAAERSGLTQTARAAAMAALGQHGLLLQTRVGASGGVTGWRVAPESYSGLERALGLGLDPFMAGGPSSRARPGEDAAEGAVSTAVHVRPAPLRQLCAALVLLPLSPGPMNPRAGVPAARHAFAPAGARDAQPAIVSVPGDPDQRALTSWARGALVSPGLARMARRTLRAAAEADAPAHLLLGLRRLPAAEWPLALRAGFRMWRAGASWAELADLGAGSPEVRARCDPGQPAFQPDALAAENASGRRFVVDLLRHATPGDWLALDDVVALVWRLNPLFLRGRQRTFDAPAWWLEDAATGRPLRPDARAEWLRAEGRYVRALLIGPLHWWGAVDVAMRSSGAPVAVRVTPFGSYLLGSADVPPDLGPALAADWGPAVVPARGHALAVQPMAAGVELLDALDGWTHVARIQAGRVVVQLDRDLACEHFDAGRDAAMLLAQLRRCDARDGTSAALTLEEALTRLQAQYGGTRIERALAIVEGADEATLREALALVPGVGDRCRWLSPEMVAIPASRAGELRAALVKRGFTI